MSAYMVGRPHIRYLVEAADSRRMNPGHEGPFSWWSARLGTRVMLRHGHANEADPTDISRDGLGQLWWDENRKSIEFRYPDTREDFSNAPGPVGEDFRYNHKHDPYNHVEPAQVVMACRGLAYQSCEHPGWEESEAKAALDALERKAVSAMIRDVEEATGKRMEWEVTEREPVR